METIIEGGYLRDEAFAKDFFTYHTYKSPSGIILTVIGILGIIIGVMELVVSLTSSLDYYSFVYIVLGVYILGVRVILVNKNKKISISRDKENNNGNFVYIKSLVSENSITVITPNNVDVTVYELSCITKAYSYKNYIFLLTKAKQVIVFDINEFTKGSKEELADLLRRKEIKVKYK